MRDLFFAMYGTGLEWTIWCLVFLLIGIVLLIVSLVKLKKKAKIAGIIVSALLIWQIVSVGFYWKAWSAAAKEEPFATSSGGYMVMNYKIFEKYMNFAANTSLIPWQKGAYYCLIASILSDFKQGPKAIEYYNKAYEYIKSYKYKYVWSIADLIYDAAGDKEKAIKMAEEAFDGVAALIYIEEENYNQAMDVINKYIQKNSNSSWGYRIRAYINMSLGNKTEEQADYKKALSLAKNDREKQMALEYKQIREKRLEFKKRAAIDMGFVKE